MTAQKEALNQQILCLLPPPCPVTMGKGRELKAELPRVILLAKKNLLAQVS
jgi:hypothetical protein